MATLDEVTQLRSLTGYSDTDPYDDTQLSAIIDTDGLYGAAARLWNEKASALATLVNTSESGSSRNLGDAHKNALNMAKYFAGLKKEETAVVDTSRFARTRAIIREG